MPLLRAKCPKSRIVAASIAVDASRPRPGLTEQHSVGCEVTVTASDTRPERQRSVGSLLRGPGVDVRTDPDEARVLWRKLAGLAPYALLTTSANAPLGAARERYPNWLTALANEAAEAAGRHGVSIEAGLVASRLAHAPDGMRSPMLGDQFAGRPLELDAIAGPILRALGPSGAPTTTAAVREILTLRDAGRRWHCAADNTLLPRDHPPHLRRSSNRLGSDPKRSSTHHLSEGRSRMPLSNYPYEDPAQGATIGERPDEDPTAGREVGETPSEDPT
jgi:Ketopantoate reductase PanE/ApbA C terminal